MDIFKKHIIELVGAGAIVLAGLCAFVMVSIIVIVCSWRMRRKWAKQYLLVTKKDTHLQANHNKDSGTAETQFYDQPVEDAQACSAQQTEHDTPRSTTDSNQLAHELVHTVEVHATLDSLQYAKLDCEQMKAEEKYDTALPSAISSEEPAANFKELMPTYAVVDKSKRSREIGNDTYVDIKEAIPVLDSAIDNIAEYVNSATMLHPIDTQPPDHTTSDQEDSEPISYYAIVNKKKKKSIPSKPPASSGVYTNLTSMK